MYFLRVFCGFNIKVDHYRLLPAADDHTEQGLGCAWVDLLMRDERRNVDEITRGSFGGKLKSIPPNACGPDH